MSLATELKGLNRKQVHSIWASYLGWTLDAFDFFLLVFMLSAIAKEYLPTVPTPQGIKMVAEATFLTLAARPFGAFAFGWLADRFGRRPIMMVVILLFSLFSFASAFAWSLTSLFVIRTLFGFCMGGEWGIGASLVMESIPAKLRGPVSGLLQSGYPSGYFLASLVYFLLFDAIGWRGLFMVGIAPAILVFLIRMHVDESPAFEARRDKPKVNPLAVLLENWKIALYLVVLMTCFNFFSHGTQDLYPTFLKEQHHFDTKTVGLLAMIGNVGAIVGGISFGIWSESIGRKRAIVIASLLALPVIPLWAFSTTPLMLAAGAFLIQVAVQGAWGIVPVHLNELSPGLVRGLFPGFAYQLGNLIASRNGPIQASIAEAHNGDYGFALALVAGITVVVLVIWTLVGPERRYVDFVAEAKA
ncbi:MAG: MFS transporter [Sphingomonas sp.]|uniref:MFS transporter n=1 Tax=Sphingomonas sp. TaxID=28214 RepID=UPI001AD355BD|nr:MFS transporter [Sphingomonas sp.]MBN8814439.1 MFS transporter [Sphingomonas sp.]